MRIIYVLFFSLFHVALIAQSITGTVQDATGAPLEFAAVSLHKLSDSLRVMGTYTEANGNFELLGFKPGRYYLEISFVGSETYRSAALDLSSNAVVQHPSVQLKSETKMLQGATVIARIPLIVKKIDRTIVNPDAMIGVQGGTALDALERSPGVQVDADGGIKLKGRAGVQVFVDDKPTYLIGEELANYLRALPVGTVKQIELMTNPPAKYEAAGNAGVINIVTKKERTKGFTGSASTAMWQGRYNRTNHQLNLNFNSRKFGVFTNLGRADVQGFHDLNIYRYYKNPDGTAESGFEQNSYLKWMLASNTGRISIDYYATPQTTIGVTAKGILNPQEHNTTSTARVLNAQNVLTNRVEAENLSDRTFTNGTYNLNLRHSFPREGWSLTADVDYVTYNTTNDQKTENRFYNSSNQIQSIDGLLGAIPADIRIYALKSDFSRPLQPGAKLDMGLKAAFTKTDNLADYYTRLPDTTFRNNDLTNQFLYDEWINAAYLNASQTIKQWELQLGLRAEATNLTGNQLGNEVRPPVRFKRDYLNLFPTAYISYKCDTVDKHVLNINYGRRIDRPFFQDLNPFISPLDKFTYYTGNPGLVPTYAHTVSLAHTYKGKVTTTLSYGHTLDGINETLEIVNGIYYSRPNNVSTNRLINLSVEGSAPIAKWWNSVFYLEGGQNVFKSKLYTENLNSRGVYGIVQATQQFTLPRDYSIELVGNYQTKYVLAQLLLGNVGHVQVAAGKRLLAGKGNLRIRFSDIFFTNQPFGKINNLRLTDARWNGFLDSRGVTASFSYRFGKAVKGAKGKYDGSGSGDEQKRVKS
jgi:hypothetical protein